MSLSQVLSTAAIISEARSMSPEKMVDLDIQIASAGAALMQAICVFEDQATKLQLRHHCDISEANKALDEVLEILEEGGSAEDLFAAVDRGDVDPYTLPHFLSQAFGPLSSLDEDLCKAQIVKAEAAAHALNEMASAARRAMSLPSNDTEAAATLLHWGASSGRNLPVSLDKSCESLVAA